MNRRTGGLKEALLQQLRGFRMNRRTGGLKVSSRWSLRLLWMNRRTGGLKEHLTEIQDS